MSERKGGVAGDKVGRQIRQRVRGLYRGKSGKAIGFASIALPLIGYAINDLKKPDSLIRGLIGRSVRMLLPGPEKRKMVDISDTVEVRDIK